MAKVFVILDETIDSLDKLLELFTNKFSLCYNYYSDEKTCNQKFKALVSFIKGFDKNLGEKINDIIINTQYLHNTLTFIIFELSNKNLVIINGKNYSFIDFIAKIKLLGNSNQAFNTFIEDKGISKTFGQIIEEPNFYANMCCVEEHIDNSFTFDYLTTYYDYQVSYASINTNITGIALNNEECFLRAENAFKDNKFLLTLAHKLNDLSLIIDVIKGKIYIFKVVKLLYGDIESNDLFKLINNTFYDWLLINYNFYKYNKSASKIKNQLLDFSGKYKKFLKDYDSTNTASFMNMVSFKEKLYNLYLNFVDEFIKGNITAKAPEYALDKEYCSTLISQNFIESNIVNLKNNKLYSTTNEMFFEENTSLDEILVKSQKKTFKKFNRYSSNIIFLSFLLMLASLVVIGFIFIKTNGSLENADSFISNLAKSLPALSQPSFNLFNLIIGSMELTDCTVLLGSLSILSLIFGIIAKCVSSKANNNLINYVTYHSFKEKSSKLDKKQQNILDKLSKKSAKIQKAATRRHTLCFSLSMLIYTATITCLLAFVFNLLYYNGFKDIFESFLKYKGSFNIIGLLCSANLTLIYGVIKKRKGFFTPYILLIFALAGLILSCYL